MTLTRRGLLGAGLGSLIIGPALAQTSPADMRKLTHDPDQPVLGNPDGNVTVIEFYDYGCPFCRESYPGLRDMVARDGNIRLVMKDWPIFGGPSITAMKIGLGSVEAGRYEAVHDAMMAIKGRGIEQDQIDQAVQAAGMEPDDALVAFSREEDRWMEMLMRIDDEAAMFNLAGTPAFLIGLNLFPGVASVSDMEQAVIEARG